MPGRVPGGGPIRGGGCMLLAATLVPRTRCCRRRCVPQLPPLLSSGSCVYTQHTHWFLRADGDCGPTATAGRCGLTAALVKAALALPPVSSVHASGRKTWGGPLALYLKLGGFRSSESLTKGRCPLTPPCRRGGLGGTLTTKARFGGDETLVGYGRLLRLSARGQGPGAHMRGESHAGAGDGPGASLGPFPGSGGREVK